MFYVSLRSWHKHKVTYSGAVNKNFGAKPKEEVFSDEEMLLFVLLLFSVMLMLASYV